MATSTHPGRSGLRRCPACGQVIESPYTPRCTLCHFDFGDNRVTGDDVTPFARAYSYGDRGWRRMSEWVWFAGSGRLKHMALMRASAASRRFALQSALLLAVGAGLVEVSRVGWQTVTDLPALQPVNVTMPAGKGWVRLASASLPSHTNPGQGDGAVLWWNPAQTTIAAVSAGVLALLLIWLAMLVVRTGVLWAHAPPYRGEQRMTAAIHYSTAWCVLIFLAAIIAGLRPLAFAGTIARWPWCPPEQGFVLSAAVLAGVGLFLWWFWLVRLGATAPARTRGRVIVFFALGTPLIVAVVAVGWWFGLYRLYAPLFRHLDMMF